MVTDSWTAALWQQIEPTYAAILRHPFLTGLSAGTLEEERFAHDLLQDAHGGTFAEGLAAAGADGAAHPVETTSRYEWMSWDAARRREGWPV